MVSVGIRTELLTFYLMQIYTNLTYQKYENNPKYSNEKKKIYTLAYCPTG